MAEDKRSFLIYTDTIHTVNKLSDDQAGKLFKLILAYVNDQNPPDSEDQIINIAFEPIRQQLKRDLLKWAQIRIKRSEAGRTSAESKKQKQQMPTHVESVQQSSTKSTVSVSVSDSVSVSVNDNVNVIGSVSDIYISIRAIYLNEKPIMIYDLKEYFRETMQLDALRKSNWIRFEEFMLARNGEMFNDAGHLYNSFRKFHTENVNGHNMADKMRKFDAL